MAKARVDVNKLVGNGKGVTSLEFLPVVKRDLRRRAENLGYAIASRGGKVQVKPMEAEGVWTRRPRQAVVAYGKKSVQIMMANLGAIGR